MPIAIIVLAAGTLALRLAGPILIRDREPPTWLRPAAVAAIVGMITIGAVDGGGHLVADARLLGVAAAAIALAIRLPLAVVMVVAVLVTAGTRLLG
jgi:hypothetical protein